MTPRFSEGLVGREVLKPGSEDFAVSPLHPSPDLHGFSPENEVRSTLVCRRSGGWPNDRVSTCRFLPLDMGKGADIVLASCSFFARGVEDTRAVYIYIYIYISIYIYIYVLSVRKIGHRRYF